MIACISTAIQKSADDTFIIHKYMKECSVKGLITSSTKPSTLTVLKYIYSRIPLTKLPTFWKPDTSAIGQDV